MSPVECILVSTNRLTLVIARAFFDNAILLLRRCYDDITSWKILILPMVYMI